MFYKVKSAIAFKFDNPRIIIYYSDGKFYYNAQILKELYDHIKCQWQSNEEDPDIDNRQIFMAFCIDFIRENIKISKSVLYYSLVTRKFYSDNYADRQIVTSGDLTESFRDIFHNEYFADVGDFLLSFAEPIKNWRGLAIKIIRIKYDWYVFTLIYALFTIITLYYHSAASLLVFILVVYIIVPMFIISTAGDYEKRITFLRY